MPTNPNIILSGNQMAAPRLPDVNAMMQTRTAGLENVYNIEQQRAAQAQAAQKEQAAAQEAATLKALLPAYTYGIQTGDIAGAGNLVPPEMRGQLQPYIDALAGKSPQDVQAALIGSLSASPAGQAALAAIQRGAAIDVQRGQLGVSKQRLAFDQSQVGAPKPMSEYEKKQTALKEREVKLAEEKAKREASGELTDKQVQAKTSLDDTLAKLKSHYDTLKTEKAIVSQENTAFENIGARASTLTGTTYGRTVGTKAQSARDSIANLRQTVLTDIKNATGMTAKEMDSNQDVQRLLASLGDPDQSYETILDTISNISAKYGNGGLSSTTQVAPNRTSEMPAVDTSGFEVLGPEE